MGAGEPFDRRLKVSIWSRLKAIFQANANKVADQIEDPKVSLDYSLTKLEDSRSQINRTLVDVSAAYQRLDNQRNEIGTAVQKYEGQARAAVDAGRDDLARLALARREEALVRQEELDGNLNNLDRQLASLKESQMALERKIALFRSKKEELKAVYDASRAQVQLQEAVSGISEDLSNVGYTIQRAEARIREMQSRAAAIESLSNEGFLPDVLEPNKDDIDRELMRINRKQLVDDELARLKGGEDHPRLPSEDHPRLPSS